MAVENGTEAGSKLIKNQNVPEIKAYKRRWVILTIFIIYQVTRYYNVSASTVNWTSILYMAFYTPLVLPASYILDKKGLRVAALIGCVGTAVGTTVKVFSTSRDAFWVVLLGQGVVAASQTIITCLPPRLAAVWFKSDEVATACAMGVFGNMLGVALGFLLPPMIVKNREMVEDIGYDFKVLCWGLAAVIIPVALAVIFYFPPQPPKPPSITQVEERTKVEEFSTKGFFKSVKVLMRNTPFVVHILAFGLNIGVFAAIGTLLNQLVLRYFSHLHDAEQFVGKTGLMMIVSGMFGSLIFGLFLDKTHKYKETTIFAYVMSAVSVVAYMFALEMRSKILVYLASGVMGLFASAYTPISFEFAMELTYPSPEGTTTCLLMAPSQIAGVIFVLLVGRLNGLVGPFWSLASEVLVLVFGIIVTCLVPKKLRRQEALKRHGDGGKELEVLKL